MAIEFLSRPAETNFFSGFLGGLRKGVAGTVSVPLSFLTTVAPSTSEKAGEIYEVLRGPEERYAGPAKVGAFLGEAVPLLAATALTGPLRPVALALDALIGFGYGDPRRSEAEKLVGAGLGTALGLVNKIAKPATLAVPVQNLATPTLQAIKASPTLAQATARMAVSALSGGVIGGTFLESDPDTFFSPLGAAGGLILGALSTYKGDAAARAATELWDKLEARFLGGMGPTIKGILRERAPGVPEEAAYELEKMIKAAAALPKEKREQVTKLAEGFLHPLRVSPEVRMLTRQIVEGFHEKIYKPLVERRAIDPERVPPDRFAQQFIDALHSASYRGYIPRTYLPKEEQLFKSERGFFEPLVNPQGVKGRTTKRRGLSVSLDAALKNKDFRIMFNLYGIQNPKKELSVGRRFVDLEGHEWTVLKGKNRSKVLWRDWTEQEMERMGREWDVLAGLAVAGREHVKMLRTAELFDLIAHEPGLTAKAQKPPGPDWVFMGDSYTAGGFRKFGALNGHWVRKDVADGIKAWEKAINLQGGPLIDVMRNANNFFKKAYLGWNHASYRNAFLGNMVLSLLHGYNPLMVLRDGVAALRDKPFRERVAKLGLDTAGIGIDVAKHLELDPKEGLVPAAMRLLGRVADWGIDKYAWTDKLYKLGLARQLAKSGIELDEALAHANKVYTATDHLLPHRVQTLRDTLLPFIGFYYRFAENTLPEVLRNPHRLLGVMGIIEGIQQAAYHEAWGSRWREGRKLEREVSPKWRETRPGGLFADVIRVPGGFVSTHWMPTNLPFSFAINDQLPLASAFVLQNPVLALVTSMITGRDPSTDAPVSWLARLARTMPSPIPRRMIDYAAGQDMLPAWMTMWFNWTGSYPGGTAVDRYHALLETIGPSWTPATPEYDVSRHLRRIEFATREEISVLRSRMKRAAAPSLAQALETKVEEKREEATRKKEAVEQLVREALPLGPFPTR